MGLDLTTPRIWPDWKSRDSWQTEPPRCLHHNHFQGYSTVALRPWGQALPSVSRMLSSCKTGTPLQHEFPITHELPIPLAPSPWQAPGFCLSALGSSRYLQKYSMILGGIIPYIFFKWLISFSITCLGFTQLAACVRNCLPFEDRIVFRGMAKPCVVYPSMDTWAASLLSLLWTCVCRCPFIFTSLVLCACQTQLLEGNMPSTLSEPFFMIEPGRCSAQ